MLQPYFFAGLHKVLLAHPPEIRVVQNQIRKLSTLLNKVHLGQALHLVVKAVKSDQLAQRHAGIVETQGLVEITRQKILFNHRDRPPSFYTFVPSPGRPILPASTGSEPGRTPEKSPPIHVNRYRPVSEPVEAGRIGLP